MTEPLWTPHQVRPLVAEPSPRRPAPGRARSPCLTRVTGHASLGAWTRHFDCDGTCTSSSGIPEAVVVRSGARSAFSRRDDRTPAPGKRASASRDGPSRPPVRLPSRVETGGSVVEAADLDLTGRHQPRRQPTPHGLVGSADPRTSTTGPAPPVRRDAPALSRLAHPVLWLVAVLWLSLQTMGNGVLVLLDAYDRTAQAAGRAAIRAGHRVLQVLGPLGRLLRRLATPVLRRLRRIVDLINVRLLLRMFRPMGRLTRWCWTRTRPVVDNVSRWGLRQLARLEPLLRRLAAITDAVERRAGQLAAFWRRAWAPVRQAMPRLRASR